MILDWDWEIEIGELHETCGRVERAVSSWDEAMSRATRPDGARRVAAVGRMLAKRSTARTVTTSNEDDGRVSARTFCISTLVNVRARVASRRKAAFF